MILSIIHQKGGVGKSTVSWNLAIMLRKSLKEMKHKLIDLDSQKTITTLNNIRMTSTDKEPLDLITLNTKEELIEYVRNDTDDTLTIIDTGGFDNEMNRLAAMTSDIVINPVSDQPLEIMGLKRYQEILKELNSEIEVMVSPYILFNKIFHKTMNLEPVKEYVTENNNYTILNTIIRSRTEISNTPLSGVAVVEYDKTSKAAKDFKSLEKEMLRIIKLKLIENQQYNN